MLRSRRLLLRPFHVPRLLPKAHISFRRFADVAKEDPDKERVTASFYIANVFPVRLAYWDPRPAWASLREETLMERLHDIGSEITGHDFRIESWEIARKDGGAFMHFSYVPPSVLPVNVQAERDLSAINALPEATNPNPASPGRLFLPQLLDAAKRHRGFPSWLGQWWASQWDGKSTVPGHTLYSGDTNQEMTTVGAESKEESGTLVKGSGSGMKGVQAMAGGGRVWVVKGRQWTEDMNRFPSNRLRVEFDGPDVSQEMLYTLFRPYGRLSDIVPPAPVPSGSLRYATVSFSKISTAATAINCLHGYSTPTNTADCTLRASGQPSPSSITLSRLRLYYERPLKAHAFRDWISGHPRIALPVLGFLIGTLSYTFFDPIRAFFVRSKLEGVWDLEKYSLIKSICSKFTSSISFFRSSSPTASAQNTTLGQGAWKDRVEAERDIQRWLSEYPSTFITITGPPGSGKVSLVNRVLQNQDKPAMVIDCAEIGKAKSDAALISSLAEQTGYYPVFSFLSSLNGLIDLAAVGVIGQKAGFSTPVDQQLRSMLEIVGGALKDVSANTRHRHQERQEYEKNQVDMRAERDHRREMIMRGGWHDGRLDCIAGNGVMSELGLGDEPTCEGDLTQLPPPLLDGNAPIRGEAVPPTATSLAQAVETPGSALTPKGELDAESEVIKTIPIVVLKNFAQKSARGDAWAVLSEWGASLVENRIAHVVFVTEGATATKALTKALPSKPLNNVGLADADELNSLIYVTDKLSTFSEQYKTTLSPEDRAQVSKLGGRMVDLETLVNKVKTGSSIPDAVDDIILRNVVELRKLAFGDDTEDAKGLPWNRAQAWKVVSELAKNGEMSYAKLLQDFPFKGAEQSLKALEEHELISVSYVEGRASKVRSGKPVFRYAFEGLVNDPIFKATSQIDYNNAVIAKAETDIRSCETELTDLKNITTQGGDAALGVSEGGFLGLGKSSAIRERAKWLLEKMGKSVDKLGCLEKDNAEMMKILGSGKA